MSKIGKRILTIPEGITVTEENRGLVFKGKTGEIRVPVLHGVKAVQENGTLRFELDEHSKQGKSNWGTTSALASNALEGLGKGYVKKLILEGVGYRIMKEGEDLVLSLGFSHPVSYKVPEGIVFTVEKNSILTVSGIDKALVGKVAAEIRSLKKPEPYKGKGFRYEGEVIRRKAGKKAGASSSSAVA